MLKVYGTKTCPDCRECKINFDQNGVAYESVDLNASLANLKEFLRLRDSLPVFDPCKEQGSIGIPAILREDGTVTLDWEAFLIEQGLPIVYKEEGQACSIDSTGC